ncbi:MAG: chromate resistance protein ChrB domain-containing protein, partial [Gemmatimonadota bacterium]
DRIASGWLIRRFIDRKARFKFVKQPRYAPQPNEFRFDMFQGEYTHRGEHCTFEVLLADFGLSTPALEAIAEIVHDIDLKDERYQRPEAEGIAQLLHGLTITQADDAKRMDAGAQIFDSLYARFSAAAP